jgi:hypothetical protein
MREPERNLWMCVCGWINGCWGGVFVCVV